MEAIKVHSGCYISKDIHCAETQQMNGI